MILTKVVLGKIWDVCAQNRIRPLLAGYDSVCNVSLLGPNRHHSPVYFIKQVVYNPAGSPSSNETVVYTDDAIRPVFLIVF